MHWGITRQMAIALSTIIDIFFLQFLKADKILHTSGTQCPIRTSTPVTITIILNGSQTDAGSLIQAEVNEKALKRIQKKMMREMSTLD